MRRLLIATFAICGTTSVVAAAPASDKGVVRLRTVQAGSEAVVARHAQWGRDCKVQGTPILKVDAPPKHGKIRADVIQYSPTRALSDSRYTHCLGKEMMGAALLYTADANFSGQDEVTYTAIFPKRPNGAQKIFKHRVVLNISQTPNPDSASDKLDDLKNRQGNLEQAQKNTSADVAKLGSKQANDARQIKEKQAAQEAVQGKLGERQVQTEGDVKKLSAALGGIVLPAWQKPVEWMMRVAAVPVQQQQFCRIVDSFYDRLNEVYKTQNEIKRNALFRERKQDLAALLPGGNFENWVVQVVEVTQAPDGSAAVMLQPPCRALMGSDACQRKGSEIRATIPKQSPTFRELERVNGGDFVVVSGKMLYAETTRFDDPLPTYAVYEPGSHCSASVKGRDADVFVTDIKYLVQLR